MTRKTNEEHLAGDYSGGAAETYKQRRFESSSRMRNLHKMEMDFAQDLVKLVGPEGIILDAPCGSGRFTPLFAAARYVYSVDLSDDMLNEARKAAPPGFKGEFIQASATNLPIEDSKVDLAFCMRLFHHIGEPEVRDQLFKELGRVSKRWVAVSFYRQETYRYYKKKLFGKKISGQPITVEEFVNEAENCGLRLVTMTPRKPLAYLNSSAQTLALFEKTAQD